MSDLELIVERGTVEPGRSFSPAALDGIPGLFMEWLGAQLLERWDATDVPPTRIVITAQVAIQ